jgi:rRNA maturation endonuclease Nob1
VNAEAYTIIYRCRNCMTTFEDEGHKQDPQPCVDCGGDAIAWRQGDRPMNTLWWAK